MQSETENKPEKWISLHLKVSQHYDLAFVLTFENLSQHHTCIWTMVEW